MPEPDFHKGDSVAVEWDGLWWPAHVVTVAEEHKAWRVHFSGWAPAFDDVVDAHRIRSIDSMTDVAAQPNTAADAKAAVTGMHPALGIILMILMLIGFAVLTLLARPLQFPDTFGQMYPPAINAVPVDE